MLSLMFTPISISTFRASFADLQVGDQVLDYRGSFNGYSIALTIDKVTATQFVCGSRRFKREDGREIGTSYHRVTLPTPENVKEANESGDERDIRIRLRGALNDIRPDRIPLDTARQVLALLEAAPTS